MNPHDLSFSPIRQTQQWEASQQSLSFLHSDEQKCHIVTCPINRNRKSIESTLTLFCGTINQIYEQSNLRMLFDSFQQLKRNEDTQSLLIQSVDNKIQDRIARLILKQLVQVSSKFLIKEFFETLKANMAVQKMEQAVHNQLEQILQWSFNKMISENGNIQHEINEEQFCDSILKMEKEERKFRGVFDKLSAKLLQSKEMSMNNTANFNSFHNDTIEQAATMQRNLDNRQTQHVKAIPHSDKDIQALSFSFESTSKNDYICPESRTNQRDLRPILEYSRKERPIVIKTYKITKNISHRKQKLRMIEENPQEHYSNAEQAIFDRLEQQVGPHLQLMRKKQPRNCILEKNMRILNQELQKQKQSNSKTQHKKLDQKRVTQTDCYDCAYCVKVRSMKQMNRLIFQQI